MDKVKVEYRNVADLKPYKNNPRLNDGAMALEPLSVSYGVMLEAGTYSTSRRSAAR